MQVWFHGCGTYPPEVFVQFPTAEANRLVMLVPNAAADWTAEDRGSWREGSEPRASCNAGTAGAGNCGEVARSCWDGYGQLSPGYMLQDGYLAITPLGRVRPAHSGLHAAGRLPSYHPLGTGTASSLRATCCRTVT